MNGSLLPIFFLQNSISALVLLVAKIKGILEPV
jgi:hypothetical protein